MRKVPKKLFRQKNCVITFNLLSTVYGDLVVLNDFMLLDDVELLAGHVGRFYFIRQIEEGDAGSCSITSLYCVVGEG